MSFLNSAGKPESWKYQGGSWAVANFIQESFGGNKILEWKTDAASTRKQVILIERKPGMQISYKPTGLDWVNEQYIGFTVTDDKWSADYNWVKIESNTNEKNYILAYQTDIIGYKPNIINAIIYNRQFVSDDTDNNGIKKVALQYPIKTGYFKIGLFGNLKSHLTNGTLYGVTEDNEAVFLYGQLQSQNLLDAINTFISIRATKKFVALSLATNGVIDAVGIDIVAIQSEDPITETIKKNYNSLEQQLIVKERTYTADNLIFTAGTCAVS